MTTLHGIGVSAGLAVGPILHITPQPLKLPDRPSRGVGVEMDCFESARQTAKAQLKSLEQRITKTVGADAAQIFAAHAVLLVDPLLESEVRAQVENGHSVEVAVYRAAERLADMLRTNEDPLFAERAADILDVSRRLLRLLLGMGENPLTNMTRPAIIAAADLSPSDTAGLNQQFALGVCLAAGGGTSHAAILARTLGIPAVVGLGDHFNALTAADHVALDGKTGDVILNPSPATRTHYARRQHERDDQQDTIAAYAHQPACTADGTRITIAANAAEPASVQAAIKNGAEGIGLLRTEFLFFGRAQPPDEAQQLALYRSIFNAAAGRTITIRTLDIGGDKPPDFLMFPNETNPFLGWRGIRVSLDQTDLFRAQLRAILRAAVGHRVQVMYPMIESVETLREANAVYESVIQNLIQAGQPFASDVERGIMIETPAAAVLADWLVEEVDFLSIGTNDLAQYTLAADRNNPRMSRYFQDLSPAVLRLVKDVVQAAHAKDIPVGVCGELGGNPLGIPVLAGLGVDKLSMVSAAVPHAKWILRQFSHADLGALAHRAIQHRTAAALQDDLRATLTDRGVL